MGEWYDYIDPTKLGQAAGKWAAGIELGKPLVPGASKWLDEQLARDVRLQDAQRALAQQVPEDYASGVLGGAKPVWDWYKQKVAQVAEPEPATAKQIEPGGGLATLAGMPGGGAEQVNPFAGYTPEQLARPVAIGGTTQSTTQVTPGTKMLPGYQQAMERYGQQQQRAMIATGLAQQEEARERAAAHKLHQAMSEQRQAAHQKAVAGEHAKIQQLDAEAAKLRAEVAGMKVDPERWISSRTTGQRLLAGLAVILAQTGRAMQGKDGPNPVLEMMEREIDRDIDSQKANIAGKRAQLGDVRGALGDLYQRIGDMRQAEQQFRIGAWEQYQTRLQEIGATTQSETAKYNAEQGAAAIGQRLLQLKQEAYAAAQPKVVKSSTSSTQRVPLFKVLLAQQQALQGEQLKPPSETVRQEVAGIHAAKRDLIDYIKVQKGYWTKPALTAWYGGKGHAVEEQRKRLVERMARAIVGSQVTTKHLEMLDGMLGSGWSSPEEVRQHVEPLLKELDAKEEAILRAEVGAADVRELYKEGRRVDRLVRMSMGGAK